MQRIEPLNNTPKMSDFNHNQKTSYDVASAKEAMKATLSEHKRTSLQAEGTESGVANDIHWIKCTLMKMDARLSWIEGQLADAEITVVKTK